MAKCPYCENEMKEGFAECDGRQALIWVEENQKRNVIKKMLNEECIVIEKSNMLHNIRVSSHYCDNCKKIIIDIQ